MRLAHTLAAAVAALALVGCSTEPVVRPVLPEALPTVSSEIEQTTIAAPTPNKGTQIVPAAASYVCRDTDVYERRQFNRLSTVGVGATTDSYVAVDLGGGWALIAYGESGHPQQIVTNGKRYGEGERYGSADGGFFKAYPIAFAGWQTAVDVSTACLKARGY